MLRSQLLLLFCELRNHFRLVFLFLHLLQVNLRLCDGLGIDLTYRLLARLALFRANHQVADVLLVIPAYCMLTIKATHTDLDPVELPSRTNLTAILESRTNLGAVSSLLFIIAYAARLVEGTFGLLLDRWASTLELI